MTSTEQTSAASAILAGPATIIDGGDVAEGSTLDAAWVAGAGTVISLLKKIASGAASDVTDRVGRLLGHVIVDSGTITVSNPTTNPETGLAKDATLTTRLPAALDADGGLKSHIQNFPASTEISNDVGNPVPISGTVTVANPTTNPETGLAKDVTLTSTNTKLDTLHTDEAAVLSAIGASSIDPPPAGSLAEDTTLMRAEIKKQTDLLAQTVKLLTPLAKPKPTTTLIHRLF